MLNWVDTAIGAVAASSLAILLHMADIGRLEAKHAVEMAEQKTALEKSCADDKAITQGANDALQKNLTAISGKLAAAKRVHPARCIIPASGEADAAAGGDGHAGQNGISSDWLRDYAAEAETYRQQRIVLEKFIDDTWARK